MGVQSKNNIDIRTLKTGLYYVTNGKNLPHGWLAAYLDVKRLDDKWCSIMAFPPYAETDVPQITKCREGIWQGWNALLIDDDLPNTAWKTTGAVQTDYDNLPFGVSSVWTVSHSPDNTDSLFMVLTYGTDKDKAQLALRMSDNAFFARHKRNNIWKTWTRYTTM